MRIVVDRDLCEGNGRCESTAPEVFTVGEDDQVIVAEDRVTEEDRSRLELAVQRCPRQALRLED